MNETRSLLILKLTQSKIETYIKKQKMPSTSNSKSLINIQFYDIVKDDLYLSNCSGDEYLPGEANMSSGCSTGSQVCQCHKCSNT